MIGSIGALLTNIFPKEHQWKIKLFQNWKDIIGSLHEKVRIEKLEGAVIVLGVCHPTWAQELFMLSNIIKNKINAVLKEDRIKYIKFRTIKFKPKAKPKTRPTKSVKRRNDIKNVVFSANERASLSKIKCDKLRSTLEMYYLRCKSFKKGSSGEEDSSNSETTKF